MAQQLPSPFQPTGTIGSGSIANGVLTYSPNADANGSDTIVYSATDGTNTDTGTIAITVTPVNDAPVADAEAFTTSENTTLTIQLSELLAGDSTGAANENDTLTITATQSPTGQGGMTALNGTVVYTPPTNFVGTDTFTYTLSDGTDTATGNVTVTVNAQQVNAPVAANGTLTTNEDTAGSLDLSALLSGGAVDTLAISTNGTKRISIVGRNNVELHPKCE